MGCTLLGKVRSRSIAATNARVIQLIRRHEHLFKTITVDNGTEFHGYREIELATSTTSTSLRHTTPGEHARTRTQTGWCDSTSEQDVR